MITPNYSNTEAARRSACRRLFRFEGTEVIIERKGRSIVLRPKAVTFGDVVRELQEKFPDAGELPDIERPKKHERPILEW